MARFGRMLALGSGDGKTVPTKNSPSSLQKLWRTLSAEKKIVPLRFFTYPVKSTRVLFKEIELWERCKTTVICGMKSMTNTANVENAGSINNPPGCIYIYIHSVHVHNTYRSIGSKSLQPWEKGRRKATSCEWPCRPSKPMMRLAMDPWTSRNCERLWRRLEVL